MALYVSGGKRILDIVVSAAALVLLSPLLLLISVAILIDDGRPVIYRQRRVGRNGRAFEVLKFRSMPVNTALLESADARALQPTRVGKFIRRTSADELPQFVNILRGEMSLVGPRPPLPSQHLLVELREKNGALACIPGLTGLAQINGYDGMPVPEKAALDGSYASGITLLKDTAIVLRTIGYLRRPPPVY